MRTINIYKRFKMPPKKGKMRAEPDVSIPDGDAGAGRGIFDS